MKLSKRSKKALAEVSYDLFSQNGFISTIETKAVTETEKVEEKKKLLPTVSELNLLFDKLNHQYFGGSLPRTKINYSSKMLIAGSYTPHKNEIKIGLKYHNIFPDEIEDTLKHEMIHILYPSHDSKFKAVAAGIGASLKARAHPELRGNYKYLYICPSCGKEYPRRKMLRLASCGVCSKRGYDPKYKLKFVERVGKK